MKKVIVIGAGIAGLTCGIYARMNGFDTQIYELHSIPGGECTGWDRKGYHFDGCVQWLMGTKPESSLHQIWKDTGALDGSVRIVNHEIYMRYEEEGGAVNLYTNADKLEQHLLEIAPEDSNEIKKLCSAIRKMGSFGIPVDKPMDMMNLGDGLKFAAKNLGGLAKMTRYGKLTMGELTQLFKNPLLKRALEASMPNHYTCMALVAMLAGMNAGDCGYPEGGSRALAKRMEKKYLELGGEVFYNAKVDKILEEGGCAKGIRLTDGREAYADHIVSCADGYATLTDMLEDKYTPEQYKNLFSHPQKYPTITSSLVFMGVNARIDSTYRSIEIQRENPVQLNGFETDCAMLLNYGYDKSMAPKGKTVMACFYDADYDYWKELYQDKEKYNAEKKRLAEDAIAALVKRFPQAEGKVEEVDVVTPMTYERYCNAWRGAWMTWVKSEKDVPRYFSGILPGLGNFIMAGMWTLPPGGLPGAGAAGRFAAHRLCIQNGMEFKTHFSVKSGNALNQPVKNAQAADATKV